MSSLARVEQDDYQIREFRPSDRDGFLSLYEDVWGRSKSVDWFEWRFGQNPYSQDVEMIVATHDGTIVGAEPVLPFPVAAGERTVLAGQPVDWIVHADHRRRGLFTRMTTRLIEARPAGPELYFNFPTDALQRGLQKFDWTTVGTLPTRYRIQNPAAIVDRSASKTPRVVSPLGRLGSPLVRGGLVAMDRITVPTVDDCTVHRVSGIATTPIHEVYADTRPDDLHVPRTESFLDWRFANPRWDTTTYVASRDGRPVATAVVCTETVDQAQVARLLDIQPMTTRSDRTRAVAALLGQILRDYRDVDILTAPQEPYPGLFQRTGFIRDDGFLLSPFSKVTTHVVRPVADPHDTTVLGRDASEVSNWCLTLADRDIG